MSERWIRLSLRAAFYVAVLLTLHDLAGIQDADAPFPVGGQLVFRLFAASRAGMLAIAGFFIAHPPPDRDARLLTVGLLGLCMNDNWGTFAPSDPFFWTAVTLNYGGVAVGVAAFVCVALLALGKNPRYVATVGVALGVALFAAGMMLPVYEFGPTYADDLARRGNHVFWMLWTSASIVLIIASAQALRGERRRHREDERGSFITFVAFLVLGSGTVVHGLLRLTLGADPWWASGTDAVTQIAFALLLAIAVFRTKRVLRTVVATRGVRYTVFGAAYAVVSPLMATYIDDLVAKTPWRSLEAAGGESSTHLLYGVLSSLGFSQVDRIVEDKLANLREPDASGGDPKTQPG